MLSRVTKGLVLFVVAFHGVAFVLEALLWMRPGIHEFAISRITDPTGLAVHEQATVLRVLFVNQGFYNLFLASAGAVGLMSYARGQAVAGSTLMLYMCVAALGAGVVLALTTRAYVGAFLQAVPAALALANLDLVRLSGLVVRTSSSK
jgi:putative membrane protein